MPEIREFMKQFYILDDWVRQFLIVGEEEALLIDTGVEESHVAVVENVPLARALYATTELNQPIPPELYNAVAEVLVYLYRIDGKLK